MARFEPKIAVDLGFEVEINRGGKRKVKVARKAVVFFPENINSRKPKGVILNFHGQKKHH